MKLQTVIVYWRHEDIRVQHINQIDRFEDRNQEEQPYSVAQGR